MARTFLATLLAALCFLAVAQAAPTEAELRRAEVAHAEARISELEATVDLLEDVALDQQRELERLRTAVIDEAMVATLARRGS